MSIVDDPVEAQRISGVRAPIQVRCRLRIDGVWLVDKVGAAAHSGCRRGARAFVWLAEARGGRGPDGGESGRLRRQPRRARGPAHIARRRRQARDHPEHVRGAALIERRVDCRRRRLVAESAQAEPTFADGRSSPSIIRVLRASSIRRRRYNAWDGPARSSPVGEPVESTSSTAAWCRGRVGADGAWPTGSAARNDRRGFWMERQAKPSSGGWEGWTLCGLTYPTRWRARSPCRQARAGASGRGADGSARSKPPGWS